MKANMFTRPEIATAMKNFALVELYTDGTDEASRLNQDLEQSKFATIAIPYYAILDPDEKVIASFPGRTTDAKEYLAFLQRGSATKSSSTLNSNSRDGALARAGQLEATP
jgi:thiol:disulfide interchange protein DsbD